MFGGRFIKVFFVSIGGFMAGCVADGQSVSDNRTVAEILKSETGVVVGLVAMETQLQPAASVELKFWIENFSDETLTVLPWGTPLETVLSADIFDVVFNDKVLPYQGRVVKRAPPDDDDYLDIAGGEKKEVIVNLSQAYDTRTAGPYQVQLKSADGLYKMHDNRLKISSPPLVIERL